MKMLLALLAFFLSIQAAASQPPPAAHIVAIFVVKGEHSWGGSAFEVAAPSGKILTLTNAHVCRLAIDGKMDAYNEYLDASYVDLKVLKIDPENDLCMLTRAGNLEPLPFGSQPKTNEPVIILGHPGLSYLVRTDGFVLSLEAGELITSAKVAPGSSGSPVFDKDFNVVGIVNAMFDATHESIGIALDTVKGFLKGL
jgi:S1-C subfamily serine protease